MPHSLTKDDVLTLPNPVRTIYYNNWGICLMEDRKHFATLLFPVGPGGPAHYLEVPHITNVAENWRNSPGQPNALGTELGKCQYEITVAWYDGIRFLGTTVCGGKHPFTDLRV